jgi:hypothetical protein
MPQHPKSILFASYFILVLLSGSSCLMLSDPVPALWFYTYSGGATTGRDSLLTPASFLELRKDGSYTRDFGRFDYGTWSVKDHQLTLTNARHKTFIFPMTLVGNNEMQLSMGKGVPADFESLRLPSARAAEDPFSLANNRWRLPAAGKENDTAIRQRLFNHCQFWEAYFLWALNNEISTVDVRSTPTLIKIYGNGFGLKPFDELPAAWKSYFFDEEDCRKANAMIKDIFDRQTIAWGHTDNKYKMFVGAFQQLEQFLR